MTPFEKLSYVRERCERYWAGRNALESYTLRNALEDLGCPVSDAMFSRALAGEEEGRDDLERSLWWPDIREQLEAKLGLPALFTCATIDAIDSLINERDGITAADHKRAEESITWLLPAEGGNPFKLHITEGEAVKAVMRRLGEAGRPLLAWKARPEAGASLIAYSLIHETGIGRFYDNICMIRSSSLERPYEEVLLSIARQLRRPTRKIATAAEFLTALAQDRTLLVILGASDIPANQKGAQAWFVTRLIAAAQAMSSNWDRVANVLVLGVTSAIDKADTGTQEFSVRLDGLLKLPASNAYRFFRSQWTRYSELREETRAEEAGPRFKRAKWHYARLEGHAVWPISVRMRALFASNLSNYAYFDPTGGFKALAGIGPDLPIDAQLHYDDLYIYLEHSFESSQKIALRALRAISTAKHWMTVGALTRLGHPDRAHEVPRTPLTTFTDKLSTLSPLVETVAIKSASGASPKGFQKHYIAGLSVRAVVQDHWRETAPADRALAHYRIAKRLLEEENNKDLLGEEFPYEPHRGRSRLYFVAESLRHFMRSCEASCDVNKTSRPRKSNEWAGPRAPSPVNLGTDPNEIVNFCYGMLFQRELNGNKAEQARALAERHGAYQLSVELLQLLSGTGKLGTPHPALREEFQRGFLKECGFALLDIGELDRAEACFNDLLVGSLKSANVLTLVEDYLDLITVLAASSQLDRACETLANCQDLLISGIDSQTLLGEEVSGEYPRALRRLLGQRALLHYLGGQEEEALRIFDVIEGLRDAEDVVIRYGIAPTYGPLEEAQLKHVLIATLLKTESALDSDGRRLNDVRAINLCLSSMLAANSDGRHHEAMGFRISLAHMFRARKELSTAETIMDEVHNEILRYGCSERTFLAFLLEAGRILMAKGKYVRAYATYLRPCFLRAKSRGYVRQEGRARYHAGIALGMVREKHLTLGEDWQSHIASEMEAQQTVREMERPSNSEYYTRDPLYSYSTAEAAPVIKGLTTLIGIESEISLVAERAVAAVV